MGYNYNYYYYYYYYHSSIPYKPKVGLFVQQAWTLATRTMQARIVRCEGQHIG